MGVLICMSRNFLSGQKRHQKGVQKSEGMVKKNSKLRKKGIESGMKRRALREL